MKLLVLKRDLKNEGITKVYWHPQDLNIGMNMIIKIVSYHILRDEDNFLLETGTDYYMSHKVSLPEADMFVIGITDEVVNEKNLDRWSKAIEANKLFLRKGIIDRFDLYESIMQSYTRKEEDYVEIGSILGLRPDEAKCYLELIGKGVLTKEEIKRLLNKTEIDHIIDSLVTKGYAKTVSTRPTQYEAAPPYQTILRELDEFLKTASELYNVVPQELEERFTEFTDKVHKLKIELSDTFANKFKMQFMRGFIENVVEDTLKSALTLLEEFYVAYVLSKLKKSSEKLLTNVSSAKKIMEVLWEISRRKDVLLYQDFWFFRSVSSALSSINGLIERSKANVLIILPMLSYLDIERIVKLPKNVRIRIATYIDDASKNMINIIKSQPNVTLREYKRQDMLGALRDGEEIIIGPFTKEEKTIGFGSRLLEHVQRFKPLLESIWIEGERTD